MGEGGGGFDRMAGDRRVSILGATSHGHRLKALIAPSPLGRGFYGGLVRRAGSTAQ